MKRWIALLSIVGGSVLSVAGGATAVAGSTALASAGGPMIRAAQSGTRAEGLPTISLNWSGYAATSTKKFNYVHAQFVLAEREDRCDVDNLVKLLFDGLTGVAWVDDRQVARVVASKRAAGSCELARTEVEIWEVE